MILPASSSSSVSHPTATLQRRPAVQINKRSIRSTARFLVLLLIATQSDNHPIPRRHPGALGVACSSTFGFFVCRRPVRAGAATPRWLRPDDTLAITPAAAYPSRWTIPLSAPRRYPMAGVTNGRGQIVSRSAKVVLDGQKKMSQKTY